MKEENKKSKKKLLLTYLVLAACLLVIAAITVTVVFTVGHNSTDMTIDNNDAEPPKDDENDDSNVKEPDDVDTPTNGDTGYKIPVNSAQVSTKYEFTLANTITQYRVHQGIDFAGTAGDEVYAVLDGTVTKIVSNDYLGENYITILQSDGISSTYKYIDVDSGLKVGSSVSRGQIIGTIAAAAGYEIKEGDHLHFEMTLNGRTVDPELYLDLMEK